jgi:DNA polymerase-3 subunit delta'
MAPVPVTVPELFADVPAQPEAVAALEAAAHRPVHAYLFVGPPGTGKMAAARSFAAALLGGASDPDVRRRVLAGVHPDVVVVEAEGASIGIEAAREVTRLAARSPVEGERKVLILTDFHLVRDAGPALLKTIEEPPLSTVFVIVADYLPTELVTIASRCVRVDFFPLSTEEVGNVLVRSGFDPARASELAAASGGRLDRARLLASDPDFERRRQVWLGVPARLDGSGATVAAVVDELVALLEGAVATIRDRQAGELAALEARNARAMEVDGKVGRAGRPGLRVGMRELEERHKRELRRLRTDELRWGLATLAGAYRERLGSDQPRRLAAAAQAVDLVQAVAADLAFNPGDQLMLQGLLVRLGRLAG